MNIIENQSLTVKENLEQDFELVSEQVTIQKKLADKYGKTEYRKNLHLTASNRFANACQHIKDAIAYMDHLEQIISLQEKGHRASPPKNGIQLSLTFEEVADLPEEVIAELSLSDSDKTEYQIRTLIEELGGIASLDRIIVGLFRLTGEVTKRTTITSKIYRMIQRGVIFGVPGRKGVYSLDELTEEEADRIISGKRKNPDPTESLASLSDDDPSE